MALPSPYYIACFPLQEYFVDKDTGFPLAAGKLEFYSDPAYTVPKDVYMQKFNPITNVYDFQNVGSIVTLSSVGTPQYLGTDFIPFLLPYTSLDQGQPGDIELYFVKVLSSTGVLQFTRQGWPPNFTNETNTGNTFQPSANIITNAQFSSIIFNIDPSSVSGGFQTTVNGNNVVTPIGPGWDLVTTSAAPATVVLKQVSVIGAIYGTPAYAIQIQTDANVSSATLRQRIVNSPTLLYGSYVSTFLQARTIGSSNQPVKMYYRPTGGATSHLILDGITASAGQWTPIVNIQPDGTAVQIDNVANNTGTGYIDIDIELPVNQTIEITAVQIVTVESESDQILYVSQSTPEDTNTSYWYDKPNLEYKPISSYTLGWNWPLNPCQELGSTVTAVANNPGLSRYVADETIVFQNVNSAFACTFGSPGMIVNNTADTSFAIIKYFEGARAQTILSTPLCVQLKAGNATGSATDVIANVSIWWTADATLPDMKSANYYSLVSAVDNTTGVATVGGGGVHGNWTELPRGNLGKAAVNLKTAGVPIYNFSGWQQADNTPSNTAKYCAIVISVSKLTAGTTCTFEYCTLNAGYIPTSPAATSFGENLAALQQFYEKSYNLNVLAGTVTTTGAYVFPNPYVSVLPSYCIGITTPYKQSKRKNPTYSPSPATYSNLAIYATATGALHDLSDSTGTNRPIQSVTSSSNSFWFTWDSSATVLNSTMSFQWVANARLGIEL